MPSHAATQVRRAPKTRPGAVVKTAAAPGQRLQGSPPTDQQDRARARRTLCTELAALLHEASQTEEEQENNGNSSRLLHIASECAQRAALLGWREPAPENEIYDVAALMSAAVRVPGDVPGPERIALLSEAWASLLLVTGSDSRADVDDAQFFKPPPSPASDKLTAGQLEMVLSVIAGEAGTLCDLLLLSELGEENAKRTAFSAALIVAEGIGAKADSASGAGIRGDANTWHYGAAFEGANTARGAA